MSVVRALKHYFKRYVVDNRFRPCYTHIVPP